jgi:hypothetical protein
VVVLSFVGAQLYAYAGQRRQGHLSAKLLLEKARLEFA